MNCKLLKLIVMADVETPMAQVVTEAPVVENLEQVFMRILDREGAR